MEHWSNGKIKYLQFHLTEGFFNTPILQHSIDDKLETADQKRFRSSGIFPRSDSSTTGRLSRAETGFEGNLCSIAVHPLSAADTLLLPVA